MEYVDLLNEIKAPVLKKEKALYSAKKCLEDIEKDILWYKNYNPDCEKNKAEEAKAKLPTLETERDKYVAKRAPVKEKLDEVRPKIKSGWNPFNWPSILFSKEQQEYRDLARDLEDKYDSLTDKINSLRSTISKQRNIIKQVEQDKEKFKNFDMNNSLVLQQNLKDDIATKEKEYRQLSEHHTFICNQIQPLVDKINEKIDKSNEMQENIEKAEGWEDELNYAVNSYDRAMIHQKCKNEFGDGSPRKVMSHFTGVNERLQKDIELLDDKICCEIRKIM